MAQQTFAYEAADGGAYAIRVIGLTGGQVGQVLDFNDNTFKAIGSATTPYKAASERTGIVGSSTSLYTVDLDLALVNASVVFRQYLVNWYTGAAPATTVNPVRSESILVVRNGNAGERVFTVQAELSVTSTAGTTAQLALWLEDGAAKVPLSTIDPTSSGSIVVRVHGSGVNLFTKSFVAGDLINDIFEAEQASPGFTDDRQYALTCSIVCAGVTFTTIHNRQVIG